MTKHFVEYPEPNLKLLRASSNNELIIFIGAGISQNVGCPDWKGFKLAVLEQLMDKRLIDYAAKKYLSDNFDSRKCLSICWKIIENNPGFNLKWDEVFPVEKSPNIYDDLLLINATYITTNYDLNIDYAVERKYKGNSHNKIIKSSQIDKAPDDEIPGLSYSLNDVFHLESDFKSTKLDSGKVFHIHGSLSSQDKMLVTIKDYIQAYGRKSELRDFLKELFSAKTILFMGYGLGELEILEYVISKVDKKENATPQHFMLFPIEKAQHGHYKFQEEYYGDLNIELIPYVIDPIGPGSIKHLIKLWINQFKVFSGTTDIYKKIQEIKRVGL